MELMWLRECQVYNCTCTNANLGRYESTKVLSKVLPEVRVPSYGSTFVATTYFVAS